MSQLVISNVDIILICFVLVNLLLAPSKIKINENNAMDCAFFHPFFLLSHIPFSCGYSLPSDVLCTVVLQTNRHRGSGFNVSAETKVENTTSSSMCFQTNWINDKHVVYRQAVYMFVMLIFWRICAVVFFQVENLNRYSPVCAEKCIFFIKNHNSSFENWIKNCIKILFKIRCLSMNGWKSRWK